MTRHEKHVGGIVDALLKYMRFPPLHPGELVRGELIMRSDDFEMFKGKLRFGKEKKKSMETTSADHDDDHRDIFPRPLGLDAL